VTPSRRELILREQLSNPYEQQASLFQSDKPHPAKPNSGVTAGIVGEDDLIGRQRHPEAVREEYEGAWRPVTDNRKRRHSVWFPQERRRRREVDEQRNVFQLQACLQTLIPRYGGIDEQRPCVDAALQIVEIAESLMPEVLRGLLTAYAVVALEDDARITIQAEQRVVIRLIQQARAVDPRERALLIRADVDQLERRAALGQCLERRS
jgi:hypothetical protein